MNASEDPYAAAARSAERLGALLGRPSHDVAVVLGSGWAGAADVLGPAGTCEVEVLTAALDLLKSLVPLQMAAPKT